MHRVPQQRATLFWTVTPMLIGGFLADCTATSTQYDRLLASSCRPSVHLSVRPSVCLSVVRVLVCDIVHCDSRGWCIQG